MNMIDMRGINCLRIKHIVSLFLILILHSASMAEFLGNYSSHDIQDERLVIYAGTAAVSITPYTNHIVEIALYPSGVVEPDSSVVVVLEPQNVAWNVTEQDSMLVLTLNDLSVEIQKYPVRFRYAANSIAVLSDENGFFWEDEERGVRFRIAGDEHIYGTGERAIDIDCRGQWLNSYNAGRYCYGWEEANLNITIPFLVSSRGYGIYFENTYPTLGKYH